MRKKRWIIWGKLRGWGRGEYKRTRGANMIKVFLMFVKI